MSHWPTPTKGYPQDGQAWRLSLLMVCGVVAGQWTFKMVRSNLPAVCNVHNRIPSQLVGGRNLVHEFSSNLRTSKLRDQFRCRIQDISPRFPNHQHFHSWPSYRTNPLAGGSGFMSQW